MIRICTDSNAQLPPATVDRHGLAVVPLTVTIDGRDYLEGIDLDADTFYRFLSGENVPEVGTAAPSPGRFAAAYQDLVDQGATAILSVHIGSALSGTLNAARIAASEAAVPVRFVDTNAASFVVGLGVLAAAEAVEMGADIEEAATEAMAVSGRCGNVFVVDTLAFARSGGRLGAATSEPVSAPVLSLVDGKMDAIGTATDFEDAASIMTRAVLSTGSRLRIGVGFSDPSSLPVADAMTRVLERDQHVHEILRYRVGPSVGAHTGPGTAGAVFHEMSA